MPYIGRDAQTAQSQNKIIDDISSSFNGSTTSFALLVGGVAPNPYPVTSQNLLISVGGVIQEPDGTGTNGYQLTGANIVFSAAPASGQSFFGVILAGADYVNAGANFPDGDAGTPSITFSQDLDTGLFRSGTGTTSFTSNNNRIADFGTTEIVFNEDGDDINFRVEGDTEANLLFVDAGNDRVAIGTNAPTASLEVKDAGTGQALQRWTADLGTNTRNCSFNSPDADNTNDPFYWSTGNSFAWEIDGVKEMRIDSGGNVGVGTSSPASKLHIRADGDETKALFNLQNRSTGSNAASQIAFFNGGVDLSDDRFAYIRSFKTGTNGNFLTFGTNPTGNAPSERMRIDSSGNVGIGTSSPQSELTVRGSTPQFTLEPTADTQTCRLQFCTTDGTVQSTIQSGGSLGSAIKFVQSSAERLRIDTGGNVGVGTTSPGTELEVNGDIGIGRSAGGYTFREVVGGSERAGIHSNSANDLIFKVGGASEGLRILSSNGNVGIGSTTPAHELEIKADAPILRFHDTDTSLSNGELAGGIQFYQSDSSGAGVGASITAIGDGTTGNLALNFNTNDNTLAFKLFANGTARVLALAGSGNRALYVASTGSLTTSSSDASLKANVNTLGSQLEVVKQLNPISFNWIDTEERGDQLEIGFIAQEVQPLVPEVIGANNDGTLTIDYPKLTAVLTKGMQEALAKIETLETKVAALEEAS